MSGLVDPSFNSRDRSLNDTVIVLAKQSDGKILIGGNFTTYNGTTNVNRIARLTATGTLDTTFNPGGSGANVVVRSIAIQSDGKILIGGSFTTYNGTTNITYIARLNSNGTLDTTFNNGGSGANGLLSAIEIQSDGKILIGGTFTSYNGTPSINRIARLNSNGTLDTTFNNGGSGANGPVSAIVIQSDGKILIVGSFTIYNGTPNINCIARLNSNGTRDTTFNNGGSGANTGTLGSIAIQSDGKILIGGNFSTYNGTPTIKNIARLNSNGTLDTTFNNGGSGANLGVIAIAIQSDGKILIVGFFTTYNGTTNITYIARLNSNGTLDTTFNNGGSGASGASGGGLYTIEIQSDGKILIGGTFTSYNNEPYKYIARLNVTATAPVAPVITGITPGNRTLTIAFTQGSNRGSEITNYQYSTDGGGTFVALNPTDTISPVTIPNLSNLTNGTLYNIKLKAVNGIGTSSESNQISGTPATIPDAPTNLSVTPGDGSLSISFTQGSNGGSAITNYQYSTNGGAFVPLSPTDTISPVTIPNLTNGVEYTIKLKAVNSIGPSITESLSVTGRPGVPDAPNITGITPGNETLTVAITQGSDGGIAITNYLYSTDGVNFVPLNPTYTISPVTIPNLTNGTLYTIKLKAVNSFSNSPESNQITGTPATVPNAPLISDITSGNSRLVIAFTQGFNGGRAITNYKYSVSTSPFIPFSPAKTSSPVTISGLNNSQTYDVRLVAVNAEVDGDSLPSNTVQGIPNIQMTEYAWAGCAVSASGQYMTAISYAENALQLGSIVISNNYGNTWSIVKSDLVLTEEQKVAIAISDNGKYILATSTENSSNRNPLLSSDYGVTWIHVGSNLTANSTPVNPFISSDGIVMSFFSGNLLQISIDYGVSWLVINNLPSNNETQARISSDGKIIYTFDTQRIAKSSDYGQTWTTILSGLSNEYDYNISRDGSIIIVASGPSTPTMKVSTDYGSTWITYNSNLAIGDLTGLSADGSTFASVSGSNIQIFKAPVSIPNPLTSVTLGTNVSSLSLYTNGASLFGTKADATNTKVEFVTKTIYDVILISNNITNEVLSALNTFYLYNLPTQTTQNLYLIPPTENYTNGVWVGITNATSNPVTINGTTNNNGTRVLNPGSCIKLMYYRSNNNFNWYPISF